MTITFKSDIVYTTKTKQQTHRRYKNMYINFKNGVLKITFFKITFKTYKEIYKLKEAQEILCN